MFFTIVTYPIAGVKPQLRNFAFRLSTFERECVAFDRLLRDEPTIGDKILSFFCVARYGDDAKLSRAAGKLLKHFERAKGWLTVHNLHFFKKHLPFRARYGILIRYGVFRH